MNHLKAITFIFLSGLFIGLHSFAQQNNNMRLLANQHDKVPPADSSSAMLSYVKVAGNTQLKTTSFNRMLLGGNYRQEWIEPVRVPVLNLHAFKGGLKPVKEGGGKETRSLVVEDSAGNQYALRSIQKFPENALPEAFRKTIAVKIARDNISASYPYAALSVGVLAKAAGVPYLKDQLFWLPNDTALGKYQDKYKNTLVLMEEKEPDSEVLHSMGFKTSKSPKSLSTNEMIEELQKSNHNLVDQKAVLAIRLLDNFVMDFDRHEGQWLWIAKESGNNKIYYPVPKDRDQAFYTNQGFIPKFAAGKGLFPELQGFRDEARDIVFFNRAARNFDRYFLTSLTEGEWRKQVNDFLKTMTDSVIEAAIAKQPVEIQPYAAQNIIKALKKRRKFFLKEMMAYYRSLAEQVSITGSNDPEQVSINTAKDGLTTVTISRIISSGHTADKIFERSFIPKQTKELRIYGLEGNDRFTVSGAKSAIKIRMIGGPGSDQFVNESDGGKLKAYDVSEDQNDFSQAHGIANKESSDPQTNIYNRLDYNYSYWSTGLMFEYSPYGLFFIGPKIKQIKQGFNKHPYSIHQTLGADRSIISPSYHFKYEGDFIHVIGNTNLEFRGTFQRRSNRTNFYGYGNNTVQLKNKPGGIDYYLAAYDIGDITFFMRHEVTPWLQIKYGPYIQYLRLRADANVDRFVAHYLGQNFADAAFKSKFYAGGELRAEVNTTNDPLIPTRGIQFKVYGRALAGLTTYAKNVSQTGADFRFYQTLVPKERLTFAARFGADHNFNGFAVGQAQFLGYEDALRGFRIQRFAGRTRAFVNADLRWKMADANLYFFPAAIGLVAFNDVGRVWMDGEESHTWHNGYGLGLWVAPAKKFLVTGSLTYSKEEKNLGILTFGYQF